MAQVKYKWICFLVNHSYFRRSRHSVEEEARRIFAKDFVDFAMMPEETEELYAFVKIRDYAPHMEKLKSSAAVRNILTSYDNPCFLSDSEVDEFIESATPLPVTRQYHIGDVVKVKSGWLSNLSGIVTGIKSRDRYSVLFKFHIRQFRSTVRAQDLIFLSNILSLTRIPAVSLHSVKIHRCFEKPNERNKCRTKYRKSGKQKA